MTDSPRVAPFTKGSMDALIGGEAVAVRLDRFASEDEIAGLAQLLLRGSIRTNSIAEVTRLGISQFEQGVRGSKEAYFAAAREQQGFADRVRQASFWPLDRFMAALGALGYDVDLMSEPGFGSYWAGNGKLRNGTTPVHVDFSPQDSPGWAVGEVRAQLAWNLYLVCAPTDELIIWDRQWCPADDDHLVPGEYFYDATVVAGAARFAIAPRPGEILVLNSRNYHTVATCENRLAFGSFIGVVAPDTLRFWS